ncbi:MAG: hypothetical protein HY293_03795, partial [Planctomycetes bacterium]|nr:hypothetical protein [Planctomycetota bacterium]
ADVAAAGMLTVTNMVMGTPHYIAPEQVENPKGVDHRADIYAIGVVFYEMLTGELPIGRFEMPSKMVKIDVRLDEVVLKALEKSPDRRYQNAGDVKDAVTKATTLATSVESYSPTVITPRPEKKSKAPVGIAAAAAVILIVSLIAWKATSGPPVKPVAPTPPLPVVVAPPTPAAPLDLSRLYFGPDERPGSYVYQGVGTGLPRNPMPAKEPAEIDVIIASLDNIGVQNVARDEVKQGYLAAWFRWEFAFIALETPIAERIEQQFLALHKISNKWTHRKGPLLVLAWGHRKERRPVFVDLVTRLQKKLGIPEEVPEIPLENLKLDRSDIPSEWVFREGVAPAAAPAGVAERYDVSMEPLDGDDLLEVRIWVGKTAKDADALAADKLGFAGRRKVEVRRAGRTVAAIALTGDAFGTFERVAKEIRQLLGFPPFTFETLALAPEDVPPGFSIDKIENDPAKVLQALGVTGVLVSEVPRAAYYRLKPYGMIVLVNEHLYSNEIKGPNGTLKLRLVYADQWSDYEKAKKFAGYKPGEVVLAADRDFVAAYVGGGIEDDWPAVDALEAVFRRKMRIGPVRIDDLSFENNLPEGCKLSNRRDLGFPQNPRMYKSPTAVQSGLKELWAADLAGISRAWAAVVDPAETQVYLFQAGEGVKTSELALRLRKASAASKHLTIREKGTIVAVVRTDRAEDAEFKAIDELVRAKLRLK